MKKTTMRVALEMLAIAALIGFVLFGAYKSEQMTVEQIAQAYAVETYGRNYPNAEITVEVNDVYYGDDDWGNNEVVDLRVFADGNPVKTLKVQTRYMEQCIGLR